MRGLTQVLTSETFRFCDGERYVGKVWIMQKQVTTRVSHRLMLKGVCGASMLFLPEWLEPLKSALFRDSDGISSWSREPLLPISLMPTTTQRIELERLHESRQRMLEPGPEAELIAPVAALLLMYATPQTSEEQTDI